MYIRELCVITSAPLIANTSAKRIIISVGEKKKPVKNSVLFMESFEFTYTYGVKKKKKGSDVMNSRAYTGTSIYVRTCVDTYVSTYNVRVQFVPCGIDVGQCEKRPTIWNWNVEHATIIAAPDGRTHAARRTKIYGRTRYSVLTIASLSYIRNLCKRSATNFFDVSFLSFSFVPFPPPTTQSYSLFRKQTY